MTEERAPEALYQHCLNVYETMLSRAKIETRFENDEDRDIVVWEGMLTQLITGELHLSVPYYTSITRALKRMGCVRQLKRGGGTAPSQWELITEPTEELYRVAVPLRAKAQSKEALRGELLGNLEKRVSRMERILAKLIEEETNG